MFEYNMYHDKLSEIWGGGQNPKYKNLGATGQPMRFHSENTIPNNITCSILSLQETWVHRKEESKCESGKGGLREEGRGGRGGGGGGGGGGGEGY